ncbi:DUF72 domain-containing protein [Flavobacterium sp. xlx-214]|uniref:DUF72 domain-containing protein n=1 Tax=unclassified Flavobacterium TaxID=196869 RepID=UPI0013D0EB09|nr:MULTISPECIES: DUF72 domain-containing protein [unclassified Flavobacterium]MBA5793329.1 DUF72 domain-containing protein [Flavobacterium sp. xlx-221]QMI84108.1 DUF72 domain-containing protein [Flavobacterium sp. xlx-214]
MKFGKVEDPSLIDFTLPPVPPLKSSLINGNEQNNPFEVFVGCAKWNKTDLKGFYPKGTKDELVYYAKQFNSIELNATFYSAPSKDQVAKWKEKTPAYFKFFPKIPQSISHYSRLLNVYDKVLSFTDALSFFEEQLGMVFLQVHDNFKPKDFDRLKAFIGDFPKGYPLAVEVRNKEWFNNEELFHDYCSFLEQNNVTNIIVDTAGRRDMLHMKLTTNTAFVRYVGANHPSDYQRLDDWLNVIVQWRKEGLQKLYFFIHQNIELESPLLATYFIQKLNKIFDLDIPYPGNDNPTLF